MSLPFHPQPKPARRLETVTASRRMAQLAWRTCCRLVDARDAYRCRACRGRVRRTLAVSADRLEHHHLLSRRVAPDLLNDPRAVISVCLACHARLTRHELQVLGDRLFTSAYGVPCFDATGHLTFLPR